jgi:carbon storage regulator CsrA
MLVLTRKLQQQIKIGEQITVTILRVKGHTVRVGIEAPREVRVVRGELPRDGEVGEAETTIIETTFTVSDDDDSEAADDTVGPAAAVFAPPAGSSAASASLRLPQRKRFNRTSTPPLRVVAQAASPTLAK